MHIGKLAVRLFVEGEPDALLNRPLTPEDLGMDRDTLAGLVGDGDARVTASLELKDSNFGTGFGAHVSVSVSVDQTEDSVEAGFGIALDLASDFVAEAFEQAHSRFEDAQAFLQDKKDSR